MLRIVKLNLYNFKLFRVLIDEWTKYDDKLDIFLSETLKINKEFKPVDIVQIIQKEEKRQYMNVNPGTLYFLFDTNENAFVGFSRVSFTIVEEDNKDFNIEAKICPKFKNRNYESVFIDLLSKIFKERNDFLPIYRFYKEDATFCEILHSKNMSLVKSTDKYIFFK